MKEPGVTRAEPAGRRLAVGSQDAVVIGAARAARRSPRVAFGADDPGPPVQMAVAPPPARAGARPASTGRTAFPGPPQAARGSGGPIGWPEQGRPDGPRLQAGGSGSG